METLKKKSLWIGVFVFVVGGLGSLTQLEPQWAEIITPILGILTVIIAALNGKEIKIGNAKVKIN